MSVTMTELATGTQFECEEHEVGQLRVQGCRPTAEVSTPPAPDTNADDAATGDGAAAQEPDTGAQ